MLDEYSPSSLNIGLINMKKAYYFSHDAYMRHHPNIVAMLSEYGTSGYGLYWMLKEMMRESDENNYRLSISGKYDLSTLSKQTGCSKKKLEKFIDDCIKEFNLFESDGEKMWSPDLLKRMDKMEEISNKRQIAAIVRWKKNDDSSITDVMQMDSKSNANAEKRNEMKGNENKRDEIRINENTLDEKKLDEIIIKNIEKDNIFFKGGSYSLTREFAEKIMQMYYRTEEQLLEELCYLWWSYGSDIFCDEKELEEYFSHEDSRSFNYTGEYTLPEAK
jgi:hypothetical protein